MSLNSRLLKLSLGKSKNRKVARNSIELLPNELVVKIFSYLDVESLLLSSCVCVRWLSIAENNKLWQDTYRSILGERKYLTTKKDGECKWKELFLRHSRRMRNKRLTSQLKVNPYTGIENKVGDILLSLGVTFQLCLVDKKGVEHNYTQSKFSIFHVSLSLTWNSLVDFIEFNKISSIRIYALVPLVYLKNKTLFNNGPKQWSLIYKVDMVPENITLLTTETHITVKRIESNLLIALWKDSNKIAFVSGFIHHHKLIEKCMYSNVDQIYLSSHEVIEDDIDPQYGLSNYKCFLQLHTMSRAIWDNQFSYLDTERIKDHLVITQDKKQGTFSGFLPFQWKTDLFKGQIPNLLVVDLVLVDSNQIPIVCDTIIILGKPNKDNTIDFENSGNKLVFSYEKAGHYSVNLCLLKDGKCGNLENAEFQIPLDFINSWFGTTYS